MSNQPLQLGKGDLVTGQKLDLSKASSSELSELTIGLGWDENVHGGAAFDPDVICLLKTSLDANEVCSASNFIFYNNLVTPDGEQAQNPDKTWRVVRPGYVTHWGDNQTGAGDGDDETIDINLKRIPDNIVMIVIAVTIHDAVNRRQNFSMMNNAFIRIVNKTTGEQLGKLDLDFDASTETGIIFGVLVKRNDSWFFTTPPVLEPVRNGIEGFVQQFNIQ